MSTWTTLRTINLGSNRANRRYATLTINRMRRARTDGRPLRRVRTEAGILIQRQD